MLSIPGRATQRVSVIQQTLLLARSFALRNWYLFGAVEHQYVEPRFSTRALKRLSGTVDGPAVVRLSVRFDSELH
jgi:hypothetical protein